MLAYRSPSPLRRAGQLFQSVGALWWKAFSKFGPGRKRSRAERARMLRQSLERLGPVFIKFGQFLSLRPEFLPWEYCDELFLLLEDVPPFPGDQVEQVFREEFGKTPQQLFVHFEPKPFASASLGQVHRAELKSGQRLAVKVQRPQIHELITQDLTLMCWFARITDALHISPFRLRPLINEFRNWIFQELDYREELKSAEEFRTKTRISGHLLVVPQFFPRLSTARVLTAEFIPGLSLNRILMATRNKDRKMLAQARRLGFTPQKAGDLLIRTFMPQFFRSGCFHADPHPANLLFTAESKIAYVDFGILGNIDARLRLLSLRYARSVLMGDAATAFECYVLYNDISGVRDLATLQRAHDALVADHQRRFHQNQGKRHFLGKFLFEGVRVSEHYGAVVPHNVLKFFRAIAMFESLLFSLDPEMTVFELARRLKNFSVAMVLENMGEALLTPHKLEDMLLDLLVAWERRELSTLQPTG